MCQNKVDLADHTFEWTVRQEPTHATPGLKEGKCGVCGYTVTRSIPAIDSGSPNMPKTGDHTPIALWLTLLLASGTAIAVLAKRKLFHP